MLGYMAVFRKLWIVMSVLALGLGVGAVLFGPSSAETEPGAVASADAECVPVGAEAVAIVMGPSFHFVDHELAYAGGYGLRPMGWLVRGVDFDFVDRELAYAGDYVLRRVAGVVRGADFDFIDHELAYAGDYGLRRVAGVVRGTDFDFIDRELAYAGGYGLCASALARR